MVTMWISEDFVTIHLQLQHFESSYIKSIFVLLYKKRELISTAQKYTNKTSFWSL